MFCEFLCLINLILGDPGSTPYNNVYASNESDSESSSSPSPTFSEISSESNDTTASTGSVTDSIDVKQVMPPTNNSYLENQESISNDDNENNINQVMEENTEVPVITQVNVLNNEEQTIDEPTEVPSAINIIPEEVLSEPNPRPGIKFIIFLKVVK